MLTSMRASAVSLALMSLALTFPASAFAALDYPVIGDVEGAPQVLIEGVDPWVEAQKGMQLPNRSQVRASRDSTAVVVFPDGSKVRVSKGGTLTIDRSSSSNIGVSLGLGKLEAWISNKLRSRIFQVRTPSAVASVRGTVFAIYANTRKTTFDLYTGSLAVADNLGRQQLINSGTRIESSTDGLSQPVKINFVPAPEPPGDVKPLKMLPKERADKDKDPKVKKEARKAPPPPPQDGEEGEKDPMLQPVLPPNPFQDQKVASPSAP